MAVNFEGQRKNTVILDFDNTFYEDSESIWVGIRLALLASLGQQVSADSEEYAEFVRRGNLNGWSTTYVEMGGVREDFGTIAQQAPKAPYMEYDPLLVDVLSQLALHIDRLIVFSGSFSEPVMEALSVILGDRVDLIDEVIGTDMLGGKKSKPSEEAYQHLINEYDIDVPNALIFDDHLREIQVAQSFGMDAVLVGSRHKDDLPNGFPSVQSLHYLFDVLEIVD